MRSDMIPPRNGLGNRSYLAVALLIATVLLAMLLSGAKAADRALIIGIADYPNPKQRLKGPMIDVANARTLALDVWGFEEDEILLLTNEAATRNGILNAMNQWLVNDTSADDMVLFYYSGHGFYQPDDNRDELDGRDETIVPFDVAHASGQFYNMISDDEIDRVMNKLSDRRAVFIFDSCHSGTVTRNLTKPLYDSEGYSIVKKLDPSKWQLKTRSVTETPPSTPPPSFDTHELDSRMEPTFTGGSNVEVWSAVSSYQLAFTDLITGKGSVFTNSLMNGLGNWNADLNKDGRVSRTELLQFVRNDSRNFCRKIEQCQAGLTPTLEIRKDLLLASVGIDSVLSPSESSSSSPADKIGEIASLAPNKETTRLEILPGPKLKIGDPININLTSSRAGTAVLLDYDANGDLRQIFPNYYSGCISGSVQAHVPLTLPGPGTLDFRLTASPPTGKGVLAAIVVHDNADLSSITCKHHNMAPIAGNRLYVDDILSNLTKVWTGEKFDRALDWSGAFVEYEISN